jgi:hypothetical protein
MQLMFLLAAISMPLFICLHELDCRFDDDRSEVRLRNSLGNSLHRCWSCIDFWTYQPGLGIGYFLFDIIPAWSRYWVHLENFHTNQVLVLGTFWNLHTSLILDLAPRMIFGWYESSVYKVLKLIQGRYYFKVPVYQDAIGASLILPQVIPAL